MNSAINKQPHRGINRCGSSGELEFQHCKNKCAASSAKIGGHVRA